MSARSDPKGKEGENLDKFMLTHDHSQFDM